MNKLDLLKHQNELKGPHNVKAYFSKIRTRC